MKKKGSGQTPKTPKLTFKEERFVDEYLRSGNGAASAIKAGYSRISARGIAYRLLTKDHISRIVADEQKHLREKCRVEREELVENLAIIALGDPGDIISWGPKGVKLKPYRSMGQNRKFLESISESIAETEFGVSISRHVKFRDKQKAINDLWTMLGYDKDTTAGARNINEAAVRAALERIGKT